MKNPSISSGDGAVFFRHYASRSGKLDEVQRVLDDHANPVDVNAVNCNLNTALHIVCNFGYQDIASLLLSVGASTEMKNRFNLTPKPCAEKRRQKQTSLRKKMEHFQMREIRQSRQCTRLASWLLGTPGQTQAWPESHSPAQHLNKI